MGNESVPNTEANGGAASTIKKELNERLTEEERRKKQVLLLVSYNYSYNYICM